VRDWLRAVSQERALREVAALLLLAIVVLLAFRAAIWGGLVSFEKDTKAFYYPL